jgi:hypothetical protein
MYTFFAPTVDERRSVGYDVVPEHGGAAAVMIDPYHSNDWFPRLSQL